MVNSAEHRCLYGRAFTLKTDYKALEAIGRSDNFSGRLMRWALKLQDYGFKVVYIKGEHNGADGLSRAVNTMSETFSPAYIQSRNQQL